MRPTIPTSPITLFASAARDTAEEFVSDTYDGIPNQYRGLAIIIDVTVDDAASTGFVVNIDDKEDDGEWTTRLASPTIDAVGSTVLILHPSAPTDRANSIETTSLNYKWRATLTHSDTNAMTASVTAFYLA